MTELSGEVRLANGLPASNMAMSLLREAFGKEPELLVEVTSDTAGRFNVTDLPLDEGTSLVARAAAGGEAGTLLAPLAQRQDTASMNFRRSEVLSVIPV